MNWKIVTIVLGIVVLGLCVNLFTYVPEPYEIVECPISDITECEPVETALEPMEINRLVQYPRVSGDDPLSAPYPGWTKRD